MKLLIDQKYLFFLFTLAFFSCKNTHRPNVQDIKTDIKIVRFEQDFSGKASDDIQQLDQKLTTKYPIFYNDYMSKIIGNPGFTHEEILKKVRADKEFIALHQEVQKVFPNMNVYESDLNESFKYIKYYFPKTKIPKFYTFISGFDIQLPIGDDYVGIGLDMFLGKNNPFYKSIVESVPKYISNKFTPQYLVPKVIEGVIREDIIPEDNFRMETLLDQMIYNGKVVLLMKSVLPQNTPDSILMGYNSAQMKWVKQYEKDIWGYFINGQLLYNTNFATFKKFIVEAPFTNGIGVGRESAPRLGVYLGWQILEKYLKEHPKTDLHSLITGLKSQEILQNSKYKPQ